MAGHQEDDEVQFMNAVAAEWAAAEQSPTVSEKAIEIYHSENEDEYWSAYEVYESSEPGSPEPNTLTFTSANEGYESSEPGSPEPNTSTVTSANEGYESSEPGSPEPNTSTVTTPPPNTMQPSPQMPSAPLILKVGPSHPQYNPAMSRRVFAPPEKEIQGAFEIQSQARPDSTAKLHWSLQSPHHPVHGTPQSNHHPLHGFIFRGTFGDALNKSSEQNKLVLLILHEGDPVADVNKGSWNLTSIKKVIESKFIVWQEHRSSDEGSMVAERYNLSQYPCVAIIDPISGNKLIDLHGKVLPPQMAKFLRFPIDH